MMSVTRFVVLVMAVSLAVGGALAQPCPPDTVNLVAAIDVATWPDAPFRWRDIAGNLYATAYQDTYLYDDAAVTIIYESCQDSVFHGELQADNLKPNFAYQVKLVGKPEGVWSPDGDDATNERIGYAGRWWRMTPNPGNSNDADYEAHRDDPDYIYEGYLLFGFFVTDPLGSTDVGFASESSYHVLWWEHQRTRGACDSPVEWTSVIGHAGDPAYDEEIGPVDVGVYAEIERLCQGETRLAEGAYNCRFILTEESFHQSGEGEGYWASVLKCDNLLFDLRGPAGTEPGCDCPPVRLTGVCPNPFRVKTVVGFFVETASPVEIGIYDVGGSSVARLLEAMVSPGHHLLTWDGMDSSGRRVGPGVFFLRLETGSAVHTRKVILLP